MENGSPDIARLQKIDQARRAWGRDIELVKNAQAGLFPSDLPLLEALSYAAVCIQAHEVGGDYYDLQSMGPGRMCLLLGDVTGKGLGAALLMANLQGVLRSQSMVGRGDIGDWLTLANRVCLENWPEGTYATLFLAEYCDDTTSLRYINCGHPSPILLRADGGIEQLEATAGVLGLFPDWKCTTEETHMSPGDTLLVYSDGLTEASDADGRELGHERVVDLLRAGQRFPVSKMVKSVVDEVDSFVPEQQDDLTILAARCGRWLN